MTIPTKGDVPRYGPRVPEALAYAAAAHHRQARKGKDEPYLTHLLRVAQLALRFRDADDDDVVIAAVLHDVVEDQGGAERLANVEWAFGSRVADIVEACSDAIPEVNGTKAPWPQRKAHHIAALEASTDRGVALVTVCDKSSNLEDMLDDIREATAKGETIEHAMWRFKGKVNGTCLYAQAMYRATLGTAPSAGSEHLRRQVEALFAEAGLRPDFESPLSAAEQFLAGLDPNATYD